MRSPVADCRDILCWFLPTRGLVQDEFSNDKILWTDPGGYYFASSLHVRGLPRYSFMLRLLPGKTPGGQKNNHEYDKGKKLFHLQTLKWEIDDEQPVKINTLSDQGKYNFCQMHEIPGLTAFIFFVGLKKKEHYGQQNPFFYHLVEDHL